MSDLKLGSSDEERLVITDRVNYPYIIASQILNFTRVTGVPDEMYSRDRVVDHILTLKALIPKSWEDESFIRDLTGCIRMEVVDDRQMWCGVPVGGFIPRLVPKWNHYKLFHAIIDLLDRRHILTKIMYTEEALGRPYEEVLKQIDEMEKAGKPVPLVVSGRPNASKTR